MEQSSAKVGYEEVTRREHVYRIETRITKDEERAQIRMLDCVVTGEE